VSLIQSIVNQDEDNERASSLGSSNLHIEESDDVRPGSPTLNGESEPGEEDSEARPLIRHRSRSTSRGGTSSELRAENRSTTLSGSEAQKVQKVVRKLRLQVGATSTFGLEE
jgi:hypothetical protein